MNKKEDLTVNSRIRALGKMRGLFREQSAERANVSRSHINSVEVPGIVRSLSPEVFFNITDAPEIAPAD
ncbi:MAG: hypothetical protein IJC48_02045 [Clostridia bacterium]|nr:hypothetical protein [Clostridia bacterium]